VVNRLYVEEIRALPTGEYILRIKGGREYTVSRTYKKTLTYLAEVWVGRDSFTAAIESVDAR
jgi:DNA-binding LytR/AlgR family response regulator